MNTHIGDRIKSTRKLLAMSQQELSKASGVSQQIISRLESRKAEGTTSIVSLANALKVTPEWLQTGKESRARTVDTSLPHDALPMPARRLAPVISYIQAGQWVELVDAYPLGEGFEQIEIDAKWSPSSFVLKVRGDSMLPTLTEGAYIVVDPAVEWMHNRIVVVRQNGDTEVTVKRLQQDGSSYYLKPDNTNYKPMLMDKDAVVCGVVVEMMVRFV